MTHPTPPSLPSPRVHLPSAYPAAGVAPARAGLGLVVSAVALALLIGLQLGRTGLLDRLLTPSGPLANLSTLDLATSARAAGVVSEVGPYSILTFNGGNEDVIAVLDSRAEVLYTYMVRNQTRLELLGRDNLRELFGAGQRLGAGRK